MLINLALALVTAAGPVSKPAPAAQAVSVRVEAAPKAPAPVQGWAAELNTAVATRKDEFRAPGPGESPEMLVRVERVEPAPGGKTVVFWAVQRGGQTKPFNLTYAGNIRPQAELLARNLLKLTASMKPAPAAAKPRK